MKARKISLEDLRDEIIDLLWKCQGRTYNPGDKFALDLFLEIRELSRRAVRVARSRLYNFSITDNGANDLKPGFVQGDFFNGRKKIRK